MYRSTIAALAVALLAAGCAPTETEDSQPPAEELQGSVPAEVQDVEDRLLDAPNAAVEEAVESAALEVEEGQATFYADVLEGVTASGRAYQESLPAVLDLSKAAARQLGFLDAGRAQVRIEVLEWGP